MAKNTRRPQTPKARNQAFNEAMREIGRSNATEPVPCGMRYNRKKDAKHKHRQFADAY